MKLTILMLLALAGAGLAQKPAAVLPSRPVPTLCDDHALELTQLKADLVAKDVEVANLRAELYTTRNRVAELDLGAKVAKTLADLEKVSGFKWTWDVNTYRFMPAEKEGKK